MRSHGFVFCRVRHTEYISGEKKKEVFPDLLFLCLSIYGPYGRKNRPYCRKNCPYGRTT